MMYDGIEYQANWTRRGSSSSTEGKKNPYMKKTFWLDKSNHFWETESYSEKGKQHCREFVSKINPIYEFKSKKLGNAKEN